MSDDVSNVDWREIYTNPDGELMHDVDVSDRLDTVFDVLADRRRRHLLYCLSRVSGGLAERAQLVDALHAFEYVTAGSKGTSTAESIKIDLHHNHLPRLDEAGFVDYDTRHGTVRYKDPPALTEWLDHARHKEIERMQ